MEKRTKAERKAMRDFAADNTAKALRDIAEYKKRDKHGMSMRTINRALAKRKKAA